MTRAIMSDYSDELVPLLLQHGFRVRDFDAETTGRWMEHLLVHRSPAKVKNVNLLIFWIFLCNSMGGEKFTLGFARESLSILCCG